MHIVQVYHSKVPVQLYGGMERVIEALATGLIELGHKVTLISYKGDYSIPGVEHIYLDGWEVKEAGHKFIGLIPKTADIVHFHIPFVFKDFPFPYMATMHGNLGENEKREDLPPHLVFLCADHARRHGRSDYIFNALDPSTIPVGKIPLSERKNFAFLGRAGLKRKGIHLAKDLARKLEVPLQVGGGRGLSWRGVLYLGHLNNQEKFELLAGARALLFPILWEEPFGLVMIEAMFCGTPVFALKRGSVPEVLGQAGAQDFFVQADTFDELYERIRTYSYTAEGEAIRHYAQQHFSHLRMCQKYLDYYQRVLSS